jgi:enamine deaminase RidA (YjgF/YER057c/UK114 family)
MASSVEARLAALGLSLPPPPVPGANFLPFTLDGTTAYLAGQVNEVDGLPTHVGKVPRDHGIEAGREAARIAALNLLACLKLACGGDLDRVDRCLMVRGFVNAEPGFDGVPRVIDGASGLLVEILGEAGRHARTAIGVAALPKDAIVEVDAVFRLRPA